MNTAYPLTFHLVVVPTIAGEFIQGVYGAALEQDAQESATRHAGRVVSLCSYGWQYHAGQMFKH